MYTLPENINDDDGEVVDTTLKELPSKYNLVNIAPDFGKAEDPFKELGPIAVSLVVTILLCYKNCIIYF